MNSLIQLKQLHHFASHSRSPASAFCQGRRQLSQRRMEAIPGNTAEGQSALLRLADRHLQYGPWLGLTEFQRDRQLQHWRRRSDSP